MLFIFHSIFISFMQRTRYLISTSDSINQSSLASWLNSAEVWWIFNPSVSSQFTKSICWTGNKRHFTSLTLPSIRTLQLKKIYLSIYSIAIYVMSLLLAYSTASFISHSCTSISLLFILFSFFAHRAVCVVLGLWMKRRRSRTHTKRKEKKWRVWGIQP
jgi:hypothetical protein